MRDPLTPDELQVVHDNWKRGGRGCLLALIVNAAIWAFFIGLAWSKG